MPGFEWDPNKDRQNLAKHGIDFSMAASIWQGPVLEAVDVRRDYGETRYRAWGEAEGRLLAIAYTWRGNNRRLITARRANQREKRTFEAQIRIRSGEDKD
jgi:uncharacterized protein